VCVGFKLKIQKIKMVVVITGGILPFRGLSNGYNVSAVCMMMSVCPGCV
jgi:hypothetical protein